MINDTTPIVYRTPSGQFEVSCRICPWKSQYDYKYLESARSIGRLHCQIKHQPVPAEVKRRKS